jgi:hypothetical protein
MLPWRHSGHSVLLKARRSRVRLQPGRKFSWHFYIAMHCNSVYLKEINGINSFYTEINKMTIHMAVLNCIFECIGSYLCM